MLLNIHNMGVISISLPTTLAYKIDAETHKRGFATRSEFFRSILRRYFQEDLPILTFKKRPLEDIREELERTGQYSEKLIADVISGLKHSSVYAD